jgi:hypothetical protein
MTFVGFKANKGGTNQGTTNNVNTNLTFGTVVYDVGSHFASNLWTPPAGKVSLYAQVNITGTMNVIGGSSISIMKNGAQVESTVGSGTSAQCSLAVSYDDTANGTDTYGVAIGGSCTAGSPTCQGAAELTNFSGYVLPSVSTFLATNGSTNQTGIANTPTTTAITLGTEIFDVNNHFASSAWIPEAGVVWLSGTVYITGTITGTNGGIKVSILKNGTAIATWGEFTLNNRECHNVAILDLANGTDVYTLAVTPTITSGTGSALGNGTTPVNFLSGHFIEVPSSADFVARFNMPMLGF